MAKTLEQSCHALSNQRNSADCHGIFYLANFAEIFSFLEFVKILFREDSPFFEILRDLSLREYSLSLLLSLVLSLLRDLFLFLRLKGGEVDERAFSFLKTPVSFIALNIVI